MNIKAQKDGLTPSSFDHDITIHYHLGRLILIAPRNYTVAERRKERSANPDKVCAIDPGVRKFLTTYSPEGKVDVLGSNCNQVIDKCIRRIDVAKKRLTVFGKLFTRHKQKVCEPVSIKGKVYIQGKRIACSKFGGHGFRLKHFSGGRMRKILRTKIWKR
jgi:hypothetical protein